MTDRKSAESRVRDISQNLLDLCLYLVERLGRLEARHDFAAAVNQKFGKIPLDVAAGFVIFIQFFDAAPRR